MNVKKTIAGMLLAVATASLASGALAQSPAYPNKPIRLYVAAPAGSAPDVIARIIGDKLSRQMGQPVLVDNKPGAGGILTMNALKSAPADGYTLAIPQAAVVVVTPYTYKEANYDVERDFETVAVVGKTPMMFAIRADNPVRNMVDAVAAAKARPDQFAVGNPTRTSIPHLAAELVGLKADARFLQVSFSSTPQGITALMNGDVAVYVDGVAPLIQLVRSGRLRALAVAAETEMPGLEGMPLVSATVPGVNVFGWFVLNAPKGTPAPVLQRLNAEINTAMQQPDVVAKFREFGTYVTPGTVADAQKFVQSEKNLFSGVIRTLGLKPE